MITLEEPPKLKLYLLWVIDLRAMEEHEDWYFGAWTDARGHVVRAVDENSARHLCNEDEQSPWWEIPSLTSCEELTIEGDPKIILTNQPTG